MKRPALLVIDMQEHFRSVAAPVTVRINELIRACRSAELPVIYTQHGHKHVELDSGVLGSFWGHKDMIKYGSPAWKLLPELQYNPEVDIIIDEKRRYDAFYGTILHDILQQLKVDTVIISGVMTNLCCETSARSAFVRDYNVLFLSDGCGTSDEDLHRATIKNIEYGFGKVWTCARTLDFVCGIRGNK